MDNERMSLERSIEWLRCQSWDGDYTKYLETLQQELRQGRITVQYASAELNRTYLLYQQRMGMMQMHFRQQAQYMQPPQQNIQGQYMQSPQYIQPGRGAQHVKRQKKSVEFAVGAGVLSVVGVLFVLIALVMLSIYYMNSMVKGMCLYGAAAAVLLFSELYLQKKHPGFASGITAAGICGMYLFTMLNALYFVNFNAWIAMGICVLTFLAAVLLGWKRDLWILKIVGLGGFYVCMFPLSRVLAGESGWRQVMQFCILTGILAVVNLTAVFLQVKKRCVADNLFHLIANAVFATGFANLLCRYLEQFPYVLFFLLFTILVQGFILFRLEKPYFEDGRHKGKEGNVAVYTVTSGLLFMYFVFLSLLAVRDGFGTFVHASAGILLVVCCVLFLLFKKSNLKWIQYWLFCPAILLIYNIRLGGAAVSVHVVGSSLWWWKLGVTLAVFASAKILARKKILRVSELLLTIFTAFQAVMAFVQYGTLLHVSALYPEKEAALTASLICVFCFLGAFLLSLAALHYWKSVYEEIIMCVFGAFILILFRNELTPAALMCILFSGMILFNSIEFFRGKYIKVFNYINLFFAACLYLWMAFVTNHVVYGIMLVLGVSFIILAFRERFGMDFKIKDIVLVLLLCYMALIWHMPVRILKSIILMLIAVGTVMAGFAGRQKKLRVTGLVLTLLVCLKVMFYDFSGAETTEKIILFFIVGLIALAISGIYLALEKKMV